MARYDFYLRLDQTGRSEKLLFAWNFFKSSFGLWLQLALVVGLAVCLSTYLKGVIALLVAGILFIGGWARDFIAQVGSGVNEGGGPLEAMVKITRREMAGLRNEEAVTATDRIVNVSDETFRWLIRRILNVIPDVDRFDLTTYVAEGFNIPWAVLAFYLINWREIANPD